MDLPATSIVSLSSVLPVRTTLVSELDMITNVIILVTVTVKEIVMISFMLMTTIELKTGTGQTRNAHHQ